MNKMRGNKLSLLFSKLMNKMGRTHILSLLFLDGLPNLARYQRSCSKMGRLYANELTVWAPNAMKQYFGLIRFTLVFFPILFYQNNTKSGFWQDFYT